MSKESHTTNSHTEEHGTTLSYVVGFILSLLYTILPYQLVVNKTISGNALIAVILGIAVIQMAIQLLFFLHLGRGPKPLYNVIFFFATFGVIVLTIGASIFIMNNLYHNMSSTEVTQRLAQEEGISQINGVDTGACTELKSNHIMTVKDGVVTPNLVTAKRCDTLTFINEDSSDYQMQFGSHHQPETYGGHFDIPVRTDRPETVTLNQTGSFTFYDSKNMVATGQFLVEP